jgi:EmrB/QacA subfamily drug resistance transporter
MSGNTVEAEEAAHKVSSKAWAILGAMGLGAFIAQMFSTVIGPAVPTMQDQLKLSTTSVGWVIGVYSLAFGTALVAGGRMGDLVGEVKMIIWGYVIFGIGLVMAAMAAGGGMLIAGRAVQGIGIGLSAPATLSIVVNSFPLFRRGFAVGVWGFAHGFGILLGPIMAGYLLDYLTWRWIFWIAVPFTVMVIFVTLAATRGYKSALASGSYDFIGLLIGGAGITLVTQGFNNAGNGWSVPGTWGALLAGLVLLAIFGYVETKIKFPLVDFKLWKERLFSGGFFAESAVGFVYIPFLVYFGSLFFINVLGYSPVKASWVIVITTGVCMLFEPPAGRLVDKIGPGIPITFALILQAVALFWCGRLGPETTLTQLIIPLTLMGIGVGISLPACNTAGMSAVDSERAGMGSGLMQTTFNIPAALGSAVVTSIIGSVALSHVTNAAQGTPYVDQATDYVKTSQAQGPAEAASALQSVPEQAAEMIKQAAVDAQASGITLSMTILSFVVLAGGIMAWFVIGRRRTPDHITVTEAVEI